MYVSQPSAAPFLQSAQPALHAATLHVPFTQLPAAFGVPHALPQLPQLLGSPSVFVSQPLAALPSQSTQPASHAAIAHCAATQLVVACGSAQACPHAPQFAASTASATSQPSVASRSQSAWPGAHAMPHTPPEHEAAPFAVPHA